MNCEACDGMGKVRTQVTGDGANHVWEHDCMWCDGTGEMTAEQKKKRDSFVDAWCRCPHRSGTSYYEYENGSHGWACRDCGKIVQTG